MEYTIQQLIQKLKDPSPQIKLLVLKHLIKHQKSLIKEDINILKELKEVVFSLTDHPRPDVKHFATKLLEILDDIFIKLSTMDNLEKKEKNVKIETKKQNKLEENKNKSKEVKKEISENKNQNEQENTKKSKKEKSKTSNLTKKSKNWNEILKISIINLIVLAFLAVDIFLLYSYFSILTTAKFILIAATVILTFLLFFNKLYLSTKLFTSIAIFSSSILFSILSDPQFPIKVLLFKNTSAVILENFLIFLITLPVFKEIFSMKLSIFKILLLFLLIFSIPAYLVNLFPAIDKQINFFINYFNIPLFLTPKFFAFLYLPLTSIIVFALRTIVFMYEGFLSETTDNIIAILSIVILFFTTSSIKTTIFEFINSNNILKFYSQGKTKILLLYKETKKLSKIEEKLISQLKSARILEKNKIINVPNKFSIIDLYPTNFNTILLLKTYKNRKKFYHIGLLQKEQLKIIYSTESVILNLYQNSENKLTLITKTKNNSSIITGIIASDELKVTEISPNEQNIFKIIKFKDKLIKLSKNKIFIESVIKDKLNKIAYNKLLSVATTLFINPQIKLENNHLTLSCQSIIEWPKILIRIRQFLFFVNTLFKDIKSVTINLDLVEDKYTIIVPNFKNLNAVLLPAKLTKPEDIEKFINSIKIKKNGKDIIF